MPRIRLRRPPPNTYHLLLNLTNRHIHAQLVDKTHGRVIIATHTTEPSIRAELTDIPQSYATASVAAAGHVGRIFASRAVQRGVEEVYWRRPGRYHGKIKAFIDAIREGGVKTHTPPRDEMPDSPAVDN